MKILSKSYIALILAIMYIPILVLMLFSFNSTNNTGVFTGFSFYWYQELFRSAETFAALKNTLILAISSAVTATLIGTAASLGLHRMRSKFLRGTITSLTNIPMMNPDIVTGVSMMLLFVGVAAMIGLGDVLGMWTMLIAHTTFNLPYVILSILPKFKQMDKHLIEAALDLGCTPTQTFFRIELPSILPGIISGLMMSFTLSLDDFVISHFVSSPDFKTLPLYIYNQTAHEVKFSMYALCTLMIFAILLLLIAVNVAGGKKDRAEKAKRLKGGKR